MSEWVLGRLLQVWKRFREADEFQEKHLFERSYGRTFTGSTIGIVGLGGIGKAVASRARALGCRTIGLKRSAKPGDRSEDVDELFSTDRLHELLAQSDAVIVSAPATAEIAQRPAIIAAMRSFFILYTGNFPSSCACSCRGNGGTAGAAASAAPPAFA